MAKKIYPITKYRFFALALSLLLLIAGVVAFITFGGFNLSIDFQSGFSQRVQIAQEAVSFTYSGEESVTLNLSGQILTLITRDSSGTKYQEFPLSEYPTVGSLANKVSQEVSGVKAVAVDPNSKSSDLITGFSLPATLSDQPFSLNGTNPTTTSYVTIDQVREALDSGAQVQVVGEAHRQVFQLRLSNDDNLTEQELSKSVLDSLENSFGKNSIVVLQSDFVGPKYSSSLVSGSILIVVVAIALILLYIWFRFKLTYALASIINLIHDTFVLIGFIVIFQLEVSTTTIAAILTIIGYSLNNVIVIFDRVRENRVILKKISFSELLDTSVSQSLTRTLYSSLTTALAILPLAIFASGTIQLFAIEMVFGIVVGAYSSNLFAPAILMWISKEKEIKGEVKKVVVEEVVEVASDDEEEKPVAEVPIPTVERKLKGKRQQKK
ncbi:MAG: protein translocase subunit SecF [Sphaerochaetaceae bacterium]|jgi:preprotein translocase subunit SecF